jgi:hypothetical protein
VSRRSKVGIGNRKRLMEEEEEKVSRRRRRRGFPFPNPD